MIEHLKVGKSAAITRRALCLATGLTDRAVRNSIEDARHNGALIINNGDGYYIADPVADKTEIERFRNAILHRVRAQLHYIKHFTAALEA